MPGGPGCRFRSEATWVAPVLSLGMGGGHGAEKRQAGEDRPARGRWTHCVRRPRALGCWRREGRLGWASPWEESAGQGGEDERGTAPGRTSAAGLGGEEAAGGGRGQAGLRLGSQLLLGSPAAARGSSAMGTTERAPRRDGVAVTQHLLRAGTPRIPVNAVLFGAVT